MTTPACFDFASCRMRFQARAALCTRPGIARHEFTWTRIGIAPTELIAVRKLRAGIPFEAFEPLYLRSPDVTLSNGPKRVVQ